MVTVVNQPAHDTATSSGVNSLITFLLVLAAIVLFFYYAAPALRGGFSGPSLSVPDRVDVNVNQNPGQ